MKKCPKCGAEKFHVTGTVKQHWEVDSRGNLVMIIHECPEVVHKPDDNDIWECAVCLYQAEGRAFEAVEDPSVILKKRLFEVAKGLGWCVREDNLKRTSFEVTGTFDRKFGFSLHSGENIVKDIIDFAKSFDVDKYVEAWIDAKRNGDKGVPGVRELIKDADILAEKLEKLAEALASAEKEFYDELQKEIGAGVDESENEGVEEVACDDGCTKILVVVKHGEVLEVHCTDMNAEVYIKDLDNVEASISNINDGGKLRWLDGTVINEHRMTQLY